MEALETGSEKHHEVLTPFAQPPVSFSVPSRVLGVGIVVLSRRVTQVLRDTLQYHSPAVKLNPAM